MNDSHKHKAELKKPDTKDSIYMQFTSKIKQ